MVVMGGLKTITQVSAGGVAYRREAGQLQITLISVGQQNRWQLPKGRVDRGESHEAAAQREVREEAGVSTRLIAPINSINYWFFIKEDQERVRVHKIVHFFLLEYLSGDPTDHDFEVNEARWVEIDLANQWLAYESEKGIVSQAKKLIIEAETSA